MDNVSMKKVLKTYLLSKPNKIIDRISPSQLGGCHRAHFYKIKHIEATLPPSIGALSNFEVGFLWEEIIKRAMEEQGIEFEYQTPFYDPELNMSGTTDFIIKSGDEEIIYDTKTQRSEWFWYRNKMRKTGKYSLWDDDYQYMIQQGCYTLMAKRMNRPVDKAILGFISKDDGIVGDEINVILSVKLENEIMKLVKELNWYLERDEVPPCTCDGWKIGYCDYGNPNTLEPNRKKKLIATECCAPLGTLEEWRADAAKV